MKQVTPISVDELDELLPIWTHAVVVCVVCDKSHVSVHIAGIERVECPACGFMTPLGVA